MAAAHVGGGVGIRVAPPRFRPRAPLGATVASRLSTEACERLSLTSAVRTRAELRPFCSLKTFPHVLGKFVTATDPGDRSLWPLPRLVPLLSPSPRRSAQSGFHGLTSLSAGLLWPLSLSSALAASRPHLPLCRSARTLVAFPGVFSPLFWVNSS